MGDLLGGSSTTTQTSEPFNPGSDTANSYATLLKQLQSASPAQYTGSVTTPTNAATTAGITGLSNAANNPTLTAYANGQYLDPSTDPYYQKQLDILKENATDQFGQAAQGIDSRFANRGFYDGSGHVSALENAANESNKNFDNAATTLGSNIYNTNVGTMLNAQGQLESGYNNLASAGNTQWNQDNTNTQQQLSAWLSQQGVDQQTITNWLNALSVGKTPTTTSTTDGDSGIGGILGSLAGGWATGLAKK